MKTNSNCQALLFKTATATGNGSFLRLLKKQNALHLPAFSIFFSTTFQNIREFGAKQYFKENEAANRICGFRD